METRDLIKSTSHFYIFSKLCKNTKVATKFVKWFSYDRISGKETTTKLDFSFIYYTSRQCIRNTITNISRTNATHSAFVIPKYII